MRTSQSQQGLTLVEILIALTILGVAFAAISTAITSNTGVNTKLENKNDAIRIASETLEEYRQRTKDYKVLKTSPPILTSVVRRGRTYNISTKFCNQTGDVLLKMPCSDTAIYIEVEVKNNNETLQKLATYYAVFGKPQN